MMKRTSLTQEELKKHLHYNQRTGLFTWKTRRKAIAVGDVAGDFTGRYVRIKFNQKSYPASCLAWLWMTGEWPKHEVDHKDTDKHNNRWKNLRAATRKQNTYNTRPIRNKKYTALKGVSYAKSRTGKNKWVAAIKVDGRNRLVGYFDSAERAHKAYCFVAKELRGEFARVA